MGPNREESTALVLEAVEGGDFTTALLHVRGASPARARRALLAAARSMVLPHGNLAQALSAVGGASVRVLLRGVVLRCLEDPSVLAEEDAALHALSNATSLLQLTPSRNAARLCLMAGDPLIFVNALPSLLLRRRAEVTRRWRDEWPSFDVEARRVGASVVSKLPLVFGLPLALMAFRDDVDLGVRLILANGLLEALPAPDLTRVIEEGLEADQRELRLSAAELLVRTPALAATFGKRSDADPEVHAVLERSRIARPEATGAVGS